MKVGIFQDIHANLPALSTSLQFFDEQDCDLIIHVGDLVAIGPYPREVMDLALNHEKMVFIMGNHDYWYGHGLPDPLPHWMSKEEVQHQRWTHQAIGNKYCSEVQTWAFRKDLELPGGKVIRFQHYALNDQLNWFHSFIKEPTINDLDQMFDHNGVDYIFYGHQHIANDQTGKARYVNLGSAGCYDRPESRVAILDASDSSVRLIKKSLKYEDEGLMDAYDERQVPARDFIRNAFITRQSWNK
jgi:putative phosphoesterase